MLRAIVTGILGAAFVFGVAVLVGLLFALFTMWMWNYVVPYLFSTGVRGEIDFLHAWGINVLCGLLFKGSSSTSSNT